MPLALIHGAGLAGLAAAWHLLQQNKWTVVILDPKGPASGASGMPSALLHPYHGVKVRPPKDGFDALKSATTLIDTIEAESTAPFTLRKGILRLSRPGQESLFEERSQQYPELELWTPEQCEARVPGLQGSLGLYLPSGIWVDMSAYCQALWNSCKQRGAQLIHSIQELKGDPDLEVYASGPHSPDIGIKMSCIKGQMIKLRWPEKVPPLPFSLNRHRQLSMDPDGIHCWVASTYERGYTSTAPEKNEQAESLRLTAAEMIPKLAHAEIIDIRSGIRYGRPFGAPPTPVLLKDGRWVLTGLGSKGLLFHSYLAEQWVQQIQSD